ncbi:MAG: M43 family zinc metalloprotease [Bacteroidota bacterium]
MRKIILLAGFILPVSFLFAQTVKTSRAIQRKTCYTAIYLDELQKQHPNTQTTADFEKWMLSKVKQKNSNPTLSDVTNYAPIPVIFHVMHSGQLEGNTYNVSQARINAQLRQLNKDFANQSGSSYAAASSTGLQFCLAAKDVNGNLLNQPGIDRVNATGKAYGTPPYSRIDFETQVKPATIWDPTKYINIWITSFDENILGYATFPAASTLDGLSFTETSTTAGVAIDYETVGSIGFPAADCASTFSYKNGKTLAHEMGHFFGLRHIWGDANCGTDYCDDTPQHAEANYGSPSHPKTNSCGTADEMFENYMDYCDDKILNTFTAKQVERMQIVMVNSLRRKELPSSVAGCAVPAAIASKIGFLPCDGVLSISEKSAKTTCPLYTDLSLYLNIEDKATGTATLQVSTTGTATNGLDFELLTPTLNIVAGETFKVVKLRIFDEASKETDETIKVAYTISGSGVVADDKLPQSLTVTILDDDVLFVGQNIKEVYKENFGVSGSSFPAGWNAEPTNPKNKWVVGVNAGSDFTGQALYISNSFATKRLEYSIDVAADHLVRSALITPGLAQKINVSYKYKVAGETDDDGTYDYGLAFTNIANTTSVDDLPGVDTMVGTYNGSTVVPVLKTVNATLLPNYTNKQFYLYFYWENDDNTGAQPPLIIDDILVTTTGTKVESQVNNSKQIKLLAGDSNFIVSKEDNEILAAISNSTENINCIDVSISQAGNGQVDITTLTGTFKRSEKVIKLTPSTTSNANSSITLYFSTAELATWPSINDLKVMKVQDGIALNSVLSPANAILLTPVVKDYRQSDGYASFTVNTTGFSQFFLVATNTTLPLQLLTFNAATLNNGASLTWSSGNEFSNKGFYVQRSIDGVNFTSIDFVPGKNQGSTAGNFKYSYFDKTIEQGITYFYRLQQVDLNGKSTWSSVRSIKWNSKGGSLVVYPNPAKNIAHVVTGKTMVASVHLTTAKGEIVWRLPKQTISSTGFDVSLQHLPAGVYMLWIQEEKSRQNIKIIKE